MKITKVSTVQLVRRGEKLRRNSLGDGIDRRFTFVLVETDTGITGLGEAAGDAAILGRSSSAVTVRWRSGPIRRIFRGFGTGSQRGDRSSTILLGAGSTD